MVRKKGLGPAEVRTLEGELVMVYDQRQVDGYMAEIFAELRRKLDRHEEFNQYLRDHPRPDEQADPADPALD